MLFTYMYLRIICFLVFAKFLWVFFLVISFHGISLFKVGTTDGLDQYSQKSHRVMPLSHCQVWDFQKCSWNSNGCFLWWKLKWGFWKGQHSENLDHGIRSHHFMANRWGNSGNSGWLYFSGLQNHCRWWLQPWN